LADVVLKVTDRQGQERALSVRSGEVLMPPLRDAVDLTVGICGGEISCGTCLVLLEEAWTGHIPAPAPDELEMLDALGAQPGARLACQIKVPESADGLRLTVAPEL
jgi:2Fe-2S ferredoxin